jgi:Tfp pilus assembly protein PilX
MVFLLIASLLALGDARSLQTQQSMVASHYDRLRALAQTEGGITTMEERIWHQASQNNFSFANAGVALNASCSDTDTTDPSPCNLTCKDNNFQSQFSGCRLCSQPTKGCKPRWADDAWNNFSASSYAYSGIETVSFQAVAEYLGPVTCSFNTIDTSCKAYRITVSNIPSSSLRASVRLQTTYVYNPTNGTGQRVSWREILPD